MTPYEAVRTQFVFPFELRAYQIQGKRPGNTS